MDTEFVAIDCEGSLSACLPQIAQEIGKNGFVFLKNFGIAGDEIQLVFAKADQFFSLSMQEKKTCERPELLDQDGYSGYKLTDDKRESFSICPCERDINNNRLLPEKVEGFMDGAEKLATDCHSVAQQILRALWIHILGEEPKDFKEIYLSDDANNSVMKTLYYPTQHDGAERLKEHKDRGMLTLLFRDDCSGLELEKEGKWIQVPSIKNTVLVMAGQKMETLTNSRITAPVHRVCMQSGIKRQSMAFFYPKQAMD